MQAIETRYYGPTNTRGSRIRATAPCCGVHVSVQIEPEWNMERAHAEAVRKLCAKLGDGWMRGSWVSGESKRVTVWVCTYFAERVTF